MEKSESGMSTFRGMLAKLFGALTILLFLGFVLTAGLALYFRLTPKTYVWVFFCYLAVLTISTPLIGYFIVRAIDIGSFIFLMLGLVIFFIVSMFSLSNLTELPKAPTSYLIYYTVGFYFLMPIVFTISAMVKSRLTVKKSLLPAIPIVAVFVLSTVSAVLSAIALAISARNAELTSVLTYGILGLLVVSVVGVHLFCWVSMGLTIASEG